MEPIAKSSKYSQGFSLLEVIIAIAIVAFVMLALLQAVTLYTQQNMTNMLRDEAVRVTQDFLYDLRTQDYATIVSTGTINASNQCTTAGRTVTKNLRSGTFPFRICWTVTEDALQVRKTVTAVTSWTFLNQIFTNQSSVVVPK